MKTCRIVSLAFISLLLFCFSISCRKSTPASNKVKTAIIYSGSIGYDTITYTYDQYGRRCIVHNRFGTFHYSYNANTINEIDSTNSGIDTITLNINAEGYVISSSGGGTFHYDNNGYLSQIQDNVQPSYIDTTNYTYTTKTDNRDYGDAFFGKTSTHLPKTFFNSPNTSYPPYNVQSGTYAYNSDRYGRVIGQTISGDSAVIAINTFSYY